MSLALHWQSLSLSFLFAESLPPSMYFGPCADRATGLKSWNRVFSPIFILRIDHLRLILGYHIVQVMISIIPYKNVCVCTLETSPSTAGIYYLWCFSILTGMRQNFGYLLWNVWGFLLQVVSSWTIHESINLQRFHDNYVVNAVEEYPPLFQISIKLPIAISSCTIVCYHLFGTLLYRWSFLLVVFVARQILSDA